MSKKNTKKILLVATILLFSLLPAAIGVGRAAAGPESTQDACDALQELDPSINCDLVGDPTVVSGGLATTVVDMLTYATGAICVIMIIYGGFRFITSGGDAEKTKSARNTVIYAAVGLAVVILANRIIAFVFSASKKIG